MPKVEKFEDLLVWQQGLELANNLYRRLSGCTDFGLKDQICRSAVSIPSNIAEGFERNSNKEFIRFLRISKGSAGELRTQLYIALNNGIMERSVCIELIEKCKFISRLLQNLIKIRTENFS